MTTKAPIRDSIVILVLFCSTTVALAQDTTDASAGARPLSSTPFQLVLPREHLFSDWFGTRAWLEDRGITPTLTFVSDALGNVTGGLHKGFTTANNLNLDVDFDLEKLCGLRGGSFLITISYRFGSSLSDQYIGNVFNVQQAFSSETFSLVDVAYLQEFLDDRIEVRIGRIATGDDFFVSPYNYVFVQNGFNGNPAGVFFNSPGMTAYPGATWGTLIKVRPTDRIYVMSGVYNGDPSIHDNDHKGADFSMNGPLFAIGEVAYEANNLPDDRGLPGHYKAGFWYDNSRFMDFNTGRFDRGNWGYYTLFDQVLVRFGEKVSNRGFGIAGSFLMSPNQSISQMPYFFTAACVARGILPARPADVVGLGVIFGHFSDDLQDSQQRAQLLDPDVAVQRYEVVIEATYRLALLKSALFFQPDLQYIIRPGGINRIPNAFVLGAQVGINF